VSLWVTLFVILTEWFEGIDRLLDHSMSDAFHDAASRHPPPKCYENSRQELRKRITDWGTCRSNDILKLLLWMHGPFGVGKSAIAQSCAEALEDEGKLCASIFFSRPNKRDDPNRVFTSIAYQLATKFSSIADTLDRQILNDPAILNAARPVQFEKLIVKPLRQVTPQSLPFEELVVILDGLDELDSANAQAEIIDIVATSIRGHTTPFRWFILSRPEPHIQRAMNSNDVSSLLYTLDLPLSSPDDHEILTFFEKELEKIRKYHKLSDTWCSEAEVDTVVKLADGMWIYVNTVVRFIGDRNSMGPRQQLNLVLSLAKTSRANLPRNPLAAMDVFYDLIMRQIPPDVILTVRKILLLDTISTNRPTSFERGKSTTNLRQPIYIYCLELSYEELDSCCGHLQSVLSVLKSSDGIPGQISYYHASFMEYMRDPARSKDFCVFGDVVQEVYQEIVRRLDSIHASSGKSHMFELTGQSG